MDNYWSEWCAKWMDSNTNIIMADFNSKYTGEQVEQLLDQVASGNAGGGSGGITVETDPIFSASAAATITEEKIAEWNKKVDKVDGKQLSTEDFTTLLKQKLDGLSNYDDTAISQAVDKLRSDLDALVSGDTTTAIKTFNEVIAFLDGIQDTQDLSGIIASIEQQIAGKMDKVTLAAVATSGNYNDLSNKPTIPDVSNKQDKLVSGTNIKTINGTSLLGSGDITIEGGSADSNWRMTIEYVTDLDPIVVKDNTYTVVTSTAGLIRIVLDANTTNYIQHGVVYVSFGDNALLNILSQQTPTFASPDFLIKPNKTYEIDFLFTGSCWLVSALEFDKTNIGEGSGGSSN